jgi:hypothetical protein
MKRFVAIFAVSASLPWMSALPALAQQDAAGAVEAPATDEIPKSGCEAFTWDVSHELAVLEKPAKPIAASTDVKKPALLELDQRYAVRLAPQGSVHFAAKPGRQLADGAEGGMLSFHTPKAGRYRISLTTGHWLDVVDGGNIIVSREFQAQHGCEKVRKILEFELSGNKDFVLQLSGGMDASVGIAITQVKPG